jgi:hypothetical protein
MIGFLGRAPKSFVVGGGVHVPNGYSGKVQKIREGREVKTDGMSEWPHPWNHDVAGAPQEEDEVLL